MIAILLASGSAVTAVLAVGIVVQELRDRGIDKREAARLIWVSTQGGRVLE